MRAVEPPLYCTLLASCDPALCLKTLPPCPAVLGISLYLNSSLSFFSSWGNEGENIKSHAFHGLAMFILKCLLSESPCFQLPPNSPPESPAKPED